MSVINNIRDSCPKRKRKHDLRQKLNSTRVKTYQCGTCDKTFTNSLHLKNHELIHTGVKPYEYKTFNKQFRESVHLKRHERVHIGGISYQCKKCDKKITHFWNHEA